MTRLIVWFWKRSVPETLLLCVVMVVSVCVLTVTITNLRHATAPYMERPLFEGSHRDYPVPGAAVRVTCKYNQQQVDYDNIDWVSNTDVSVKGVVYPVLRDACTLAKL